MFSEVYHEDVRQAYCNAVDFLVDVVYAKGDEDLKKYLKNYEGFKESIESKEDLEIKSEDDIKKKLNLKRQTFRQINLMFERLNFWKGTGTSNE